MPVEVDFEAKETEELVDYSFYATHAEENLLVDFDSINPSAVDEMLSQPYYASFNPYDQPYQVDLPELEYISPDLIVAPSKRKHYKGRADRLNDQSDDDEVEGGRAATFSERRSYPPCVKQYLIRWLHRYNDNPYPSLRIKTKLAENTSLTLTQIEV
jgi:hypothetical protein